MLIICLMDVGDSFLFQGIENNIYFFTPRYPIRDNSQRARRTAGCGVWLGCGKDKHIKVGSRLIRYKTQLTFVMLEKNVWITAKQFKLNIQEGRNFLILIEASEALSLRIDRAPLKEYLSVASWWWPTLQDGPVSMHSQCIGPRSTWFFSSGEAGRNWIV